MGNEEADVICPLGTVPKDPTVKCQADKTFLPIPTCVPDVAKDSGETALWDITAWITEKEGKSFPDRNNPRKSPRCCCDANSVASNRRCTISLVDQCKEVDAQKFAWVKEGKGFLGTAVKKVSHFRHYGKCLIPAGYVRQAYWWLGSPEGYCPSTVGYGGDRVQLIH